MQYSSPSGTYPLVQLQLRGIPRKQLWLDVTEDFLEDYIREKVDIKVGPSHAKGQW